RRGLVGNRLQSGKAGRIGCDDELAAAAMRNPSRLAIGVQARRAVDADAGFQRTGRVVEAGGNHLAVARADAQPETSFALEDEYCAAGLCKRASDRQSEYAGAYDDGFRALHDWRPNSGGSPPCSDPGD